jgi:tyrosinase
MTSPLAPFTKVDGTTYTAADCIDIEAQLGYTYAPGSFDDSARDDPRPDGLVADALALPAQFAGRKLRVGGIDRALFQGSFVVHGWASSPGSGGRAAMALPRPPFGAQPARRRSMCQLPDSP